MYRLKYRQILVLAVQSTPMRSNCQLDKGREGYLVLRVHKPSCQWCLTQPVLVRPKKSGRKAAGEARKMCVAVPNILAKGSLRARCIPQAVVRIGIEPHRTIETAGRFITTRGVPPGFPRPHGQRHTVEPRAPIRKPRRADT